MKRKILLLFGDTHAGGSTGLVHPGTELQHITHDGIVTTVHPELSEIQKFLFEEIYLPGIKQVVEFSEGDEIIAIHQGDITQGIKYDASVSIAPQILIATTNMAELLQYPNLKKLRLIKGTASHSMGDSSDSDILVAEILKKAFPEKDIAVHQHGMYFIDEVDTLVDCSHHGPSRGIRVWLEGNQFRFYLKDLILRRKIRGLRIPDIVSRAHTHGKMEEYLCVGDDRVWGFITPPMQYPGSYAFQYTRSIEEIEMGLLMVEIIWHSPTKKTIYPYWITKQINIPTREVL